MTHTNNTAPHSPEPQNAASRSPEPRTAGSHGPESHQAASTLTVASASLLPPVVAPTRRFNDPKNIRIGIAGIIGVMALTIAIFVAILATVYVVSGSIGDPNSLFLGLMQYSLIGTIFIGAMTWASFAFAHSYGMTRRSVLRQTAGLTAILVAVQEVALIIIDIVALEVLAPQQAMVVKNNLGALVGMLVAIALVAAVWLATMYYMYFVSNSKLKSGLVLAVTLILFSQALSNYGGSIGGITWFIVQIAIIDVLMAVWIVFLGAKIAGDKGYAMTRATFNS